jgi:hypothetical protein
MPGGATRLVRAAASWARFQQVAVVWFGLSVGPIAVLVGCAAQERNPATTTAVTGSSGEALDAGEAHREILDVTGERLMRYGPIEIAVVGGEITNTDPDSNEVVAASEDWFAVLDTEVTKVVDVEYAITGSSARLVLADGSDALNREMGRVEAEIGGSVMKQFVFRVPPGSSWAGSSLEFGRFENVVAVLALTGPVPEPDLPLWLEPGATGQAGDLAVLVVDARVTLDSAAGERAARDTKYVETTLQLVNNGHEDLQIDAGLFRFVFTGQIVEPVEVPAVALAPLSSIEASLVFAVPAETAAGEVLVNSPGASAAVSIAVDLSEGQPDDEPYTKPDPITPQATTTTTTPLGDGDGESESPTTSTSTTTPTS